MTAVIGIADSCGVCWMMKGIEEEEKKKTKEEMSQDEAEVEDIEDGLCWSNPFQIINPNNAQQ